MIRWAEKVTAVLVSPRPLNEFSPPPVRRGLSSVAGQLYGLRSHSRDLLSEGVVLLGPLRGQSESDCGLAGQFSLVEGLSLGDARTKQPRAVLFQKVIDHRVDSRCPDFERVGQNPVAQVFHLLNAKPGLFSQKLLCGHDVEAFVICRQDRQARLRGFLH